MSSLVTTSTATKSNSIIDSHSSQVNTKPPRKLMYNTYIVHVSPYDVFSLLYTLAALYVAIFWMLILRQGGRKISLGGGGTIVGLVFPRALHCILVKILVCMNSLKSGGGGTSTRCPPASYPPVRTHVRVL